MSEENKLKPAASFIDENSPFEPWIWLPEDEYPERRKTGLSCLCAGDKNYTVALFKREYDFKNREIEKISLVVSGDTAFLLFADEKPFLRGPASVGGDFLYNDVLRPEFYAFEKELAQSDCTGLKDGKITFSALVRMGSVRICEYSRGEGGFMLIGRVHFADGGEELIASDETWEARLLADYTSEYRYDGSVAQEREVRPQKKTPPVKTLIAPIPPCDEHSLPLENGGIIALQNESIAEKTFALNKTYACYLNAHVKTVSPVKVTVEGGEISGETCWRYELDFTRDASYYGMELQSAGEIRVKAQSSENKPCEVRVELMASHYPVKELARTKTSDKALNLVLEVCAHSLKYCRQTHHLDSPKHCEPLACTGDYYIETLMTAFTFGDMRLAEFDIHRTANLLRQHDGEMFHTSYSLIWVQMLRDVYRLTGKKELLEQNLDALRLLLKRFSGYVGENGLIETPPNYMFIDWLNPDGINLHHPPKALGQTCMCMFYYGALKTAEKIYSEIGDTRTAAVCASKSAALHRAIYENLWDKNRQLFFEGLNTPTKASLIGEWMPENVNKRYYRLHANVLAAYFEFFETEKNQALLRRIIFNEALGEAQPYFQHFLLDAVNRNGLREEYTLKLLNQWKAPVMSCPKGLPEGFFKPDPGYSFDRSHAWAGTPAYALPLALTGLKMIEPGYKKISLDPSSLGLKEASAEIPTPYGKIRIRVSSVNKPVIEVPEGIEVV
ncbi:MAG: hypothetical protein IJS90_05460 [Clostridia bacterium]|nr:hypothetical protein [Clostridia bacterium]